MLLTLFGSNMLGTPREEASVSLFTLVGVRGVVRGRDNERGLEFVLEGLGKLGPHIGGTSATRK